MCDIEVFVDFLNTLHDNRNEIISYAVTGAPLNYGFSFGSCYTLCGALGITGANNLNLLDIFTDVNGTDPPTVQFSNCNANPLSAILRVSIKANGVTLNVRGRAQSPNTTWPDTGSVEITKNVFLSGEILFTFPMTNVNIDFTNYLVSINFIGTWESIPAWPNTDNILFNRVPIEKLITEWTTQFNEYVKKRFEKKIKKLVLLPILGYTCSIPSYVPMACTAAMKTLDFTTITSCHPCDDCCKCFMQQRCDSGCDKCACVNCITNPLIVGPLLITLYITILVIILIWKCYKNQFNKA